MFIAYYYNQLQTASKGDTLLFPIWILKVNLKIPKAFNLSQEQGTSLFKTAVLS